MIRPEWPKFTDEFGAYELQAWKVEHGYVWCDVLECEALDNPATHIEMREAYVHWRHHEYLAGCSHGR